VLDPSFGEVKMRGYSTVEPIRVVLFTEICLALRAARKDG
jgi:hypothetical protein